MSALLVRAAPVSACQSTSLRSAWFDTDYSGPPLRKILVAGVDAVASHAVTAAAAGSDAAFVTAVTNSGARGLLPIQVLGVDTRTQVSTTMVPGGMARGRSPWGAPVGRQMVPVQQVRQYDLATVEAKRFDVQSRQLASRGIIAGR